MNVLKFLVNAWSLLPQNWTIWWVWSGTKLKEHSTYSPIYKGRDSRARSSHGGYSMSQKSLYCRVAYSVRLVKAISTSPALSLWRLLQSQWTGWKNFVEGYNSMSKAKFWAFIMVMALIVFASVNSGCGGSCSNPINTNKGNIYNQWPPIRQQHNQQRPIRQHLLRHKQQH